MNRVVHISWIGRKLISFVDLHQRSWGSVVTLPISILLQILRHHGTSKDDLVVQTFSILIKHEFHWVYVGLRLRWMVGSAMIDLQGLVLVLLIDTYLIMTSAT